MSPCQEHHQNRQHPCCDGGGKRQPRRLRADQRRRRWTRDGVGGAGHGGFCLRRSLFRRRGQITVGTGQGRSRRRLLRGCFLRRGLLGCLLRRCLFRGLRRCFLGCLGGSLLRRLAGAFLAGGAGGSVAAALAVRWQVGPDLDLASTRPVPLPVPRRQAFRRVDPVGLPSGCSFAPVCSPRQWLPSCQAGYGANRSLPAQLPGSARRP